MKIARSVILAFLLSAFTAYGQTLTPVANPSVLDSSGKFMGHILGYGPGGYIYLLFKWNVNDDVVLTLRKVPGSALAWGQGILYYQSPDCSGQAYGLDAGIGERFATIGPNNVLYLSAPGALPQQSITTNSVSHPGSPCQAAPNTPAFNTVPVNPTVSLDTLFQGPFRVTNVDQQSVPMLSPLVLALLAGSLAAAGLIIMKH